MGTSPIKSFTLKVLSATNQHIAVNIARALPEWFTEKAIERMLIDLIYQRGALVMDGENPLGFISFFVNQGKAEIGWMGVMPDQQDQGIGKFLINKLVTELSGVGVSEISLKLMADSVEYEPYERTRAFFRSYGFIDAGTIRSEDSGFAEALILVFKL